MPPLEALSLEASRAEDGLGQQPHHLGSVDSMPGLPTQLLADRLRHILGYHHPGQGGWEGGPLGLPQLVDCRFLGDSRVR